MMFRCAIFSLSMLLFVSGCVYNGFKHHYTPTASSGAIQCTTEPAVYSAQGPVDDKTTLQMWSKGYTSLGESNFWCTETVEMKDAIEQGKAVGACVILFYSKHAGTVQGYYPVFDYTPPAQYNTQYNAFYGGKAFQANVVTKEQGYGQTTTTYVPYQKDKHDYLVSYWGKAPKPKVGLWVTNLSDDVRSVLKRNTGGLVVAVYDGSAAFLANIIPGDVLIKINDADIFTSDDYTKAVRLMQGPTTLTVTLLRDGKETVKTVTLE